ncbi:MAG TPA: acetate--CoA ligase [Chloroflexota bacterium]
MNGEIVWEPSEEHLRRSRLLRLMRAQGFDDYQRFFQRSVDDVAWFWETTVRDLGVEFFQPYRQVLDTSRGVEWARWFRGGAMNIVHSCLDRHVGGSARDRLAVVWEGEEGISRRLTYAELADDVGRLANALLALGVRRGDAVGVYLPMVPEVAVAILAIARIGAIFTPIFSGYGPEAVALRLQDCQAKVLVTANAFLRRGRVVDMKRTADESVAAAPCVEHVLVCRRLDAPTPWTEGRDHWWHDLVARQSPVCPPAVMDPEDPFMLIYTSGTTGRSKGAVHVHCGFPIKAAQDLAHCFDVQEDDRVLWYTDIGWMMGPWLILGTSLLGATMVLYDGVPDHPLPDRLWEIVERHHVTVLGVSPTVVRGLMRHGEEWVRRHDRSSLRALGSTGEPWNPEPWMWFFEQVGERRCPIVNYSGGTEISGGIVSGSTILPLKPCAFAGPVPGMDADVLSDDGRPVRDEVGELVIRKPWLGMTRGFWNDDQRYLETYWSRWPGVWVHGDWARIDADGFWYILGRSDDTIKVAGKRVGPAEVESALVAHPAVSEAAAIGVPHDLKGEVVVGFVVLKPGYEPDDALREALKEQVAARLGRALRPEEIKFVGDLPKTRNAKIMRRVVRACYLGQDAGDLSALENPRAADEIARAR